MPSASLTEVTGTPGSCNGGQKIAFAATAGTTYSFRYAAYADGQTGSFFLRFATAIAPVNDDFAGAVAAGLSHLPHGLERRRHDRGRTSRTRWTARPADIRSGIA